MIHWESCFFVECFTELKHYTLFPESCHFRAVVRGRGEPEIIIKSLRTTDKYTRAQNLHT